VLFPAEGICHNKFYVPFNVLKLDLLACRCWAVFKEADEKNEEGQTHEHPPVFRISSSAMILVFLIEYNLFSNESNDYSSEEMQ